MAARNNNIDWGRLAEERLRTGKTFEQQAREHRANSGNGGAKTEAKPEPHGAKATGEAKPAYRSRGVAVAETRHAERREPQVLPTVEQCEALQDHQEYLFFRDGMWQTFLKETKGLSLTEDQRREEFMVICKQFLQEDIKVLVERGNLKNWEQFVAAPAKKSAAGIVPEGDLDEGEEVEILPDGSVVPRSGESAEAALEGESKYLDRHAMSPLLSKFFALTEEQQGESGIDINMLFYFLEGRGKVDEDFFPATVEGKTVTKEQYLAEAKKLEDFFSPKREALTEVKDWREVKRETEVFVIGDLHGNIEALEGNLEKLGLIKNDKGLLEWSGGKARVVFEGDILADRNTNGLNILYKIGRLQEQAKKAGGEIEVIAGNHDDFAISFLMGVEGAGNADCFESCRQGGYLGLLELARYGSSELQQSMGNALAFQAKGPASAWSRRNMEAFADLNKIRPDHPAWQMLKEERQQILENMRSDPKGRQILEVMCNMKLATRKDDTLIVHTNPTPKIVDYLQSGPNLDQSIKFVNDWYQGSLRKSLLDGGQVKPEFIAIKGLFLDTDNRDDFINAYQYDSGDLRKGEAKVKDMVAKLKGSGVNALIHGHSDEGGNRVTGKAVDFPVISVDFSAYKTKTRLDKKSVLKISRDGKMQIGKDMETIRG